MTESVWDLIIPAACCAIFIFGLVAAARYPRRLSNHRELLALTYGPPPTGPETPPAVVVPFPGRQRGAPPRSPRAQERAAVQQLRPRTGAVHAAPTRCPVSPE